MRKIESFMPEEPARDAALASTSFPRSALYVSSDAPCDATHNAKDEHRGNHAEYDFGNRVDHRVIGLLSVGGTSSVPASDNAELHPRESRRCKTQESCFEEVVSARQLFLAPM